MGKDPQLSKHQIIEKMWADKNFKTEDGASQSEHVNNIKLACSLYCSSTLIIINC